MALTEVNSLGIKDGEVKTADIAADAVTGAKIADDQIDSEHYVAASIDHEHLADDAVDGDIIADNAVGLAHMAGGTDGVIITYDASGNPVHVGPGNDGQVLTSTGAGSPPAFEDVPAGGATINNATENELVTVASTTTQLDAEANLTYNGTTTLTSVSGSDNHLILKSATSGYSRICLGDTDDDDIGEILYNNSGNKLSIKTNATTHLEIESGGDVKINDGNLVIGTSGHGIDFSATSDAGGMSNEVLDDYEEGTWDPVLYSTGGGDDFGYSSRNGFYQKIGGVVHYYVNIQWTKGSGVTAGYVYCKGFPFTTRPNAGSYYYIGSNMELGGLDANRPFVCINANGNNTIATYNTGGSTGLTGFCETGDIGSSGSSWFSLTVFTNA